MTQPQVTILAAGMGTRLGRPFPKDVLEFYSYQDLVLHTERTPLTEFAELILALS